MRSAQVLLSLLFVPLFLYAQEKHADIPASRSAS